eukprot:269676-Amphidinium_carterae.1
MAVESARVRVQDGDPRSLTVVETSQVGLIWRIAKKMTSLAGGAAWAESDVEDPLVVPEKRAAPPPVEPSVTQSHKKIKMANVIDQTDDSELATDGKNEQGQWVKNYIELMRAAPLPEEEPSTVGRSSSSGLRCTRNSLR